MGSISFVKQRDATAQVQMAEEEPRRLLEQRVGQGGAESPGAQKNATFLRSHFMRPTGT